ncbi:hypothetical protein JTE90_029285 [Oedothorax gibbosus]|uniref:Uncharacterized protein n=1 Tax=Oedothorax gibbosus TaxID=931172 RepID=A0AAV6U626_9ARAC|nr:hypothetical protein JTE90_029285 [Oedothorax gibbosus]
MCINPLDIPRTFITKPRLMTHFTFTLKSAPKLLNKFLEQERKVSSQRKKAVSQSFMKGKTLGDFEFRFHVDIQNTHFVPKKYGEREKKWCLLQ